MMSIKNVIYYWDILSSKNRLVKAEAKEWIYLNSVSSHCALGKSSIARSPSQTFKVIEKF